MRELESLREVGIEYLVTQSLFILLWLLFQYKDYALPTEENNVSYIYFLSFYGGIKYFIILSNLQITFLLLVETFISLFEKESLNRLKTINFILQNMFIATTMAES
jgi:hypothetical protein